MLCLSENEQGLNDQQQQTNDCFAPACLERSLPNTLFTLRIFTCERADCLSVQCKSPFSFSQSPPSTRATTSPLRPTPTTTWSPRPSTGRTYPAASPKLPAGCRRPPPEGAAWLKTSHSKPPCRFWPITTWEGRAASNCRTYSLIWTWTSIPMSSGNKRWVCRCEWRPGCQLFNACPLTSLVTSFQDTATGSVKINI